MYHSPSLKTYLDNLRGSENFGENQVLIMADDSEFPDSEGCIMDSRGDQEVPSAKAHIACTDPTHVDMDTLVKPPGAVLTRCCTGCGLIGRACDCSQPAVYRWFGIAKRTQRCSKCRGTGHNRRNCDAPI